MKAVSLLNNMKSRFLSLPRSVAEGLEREPNKSDFEFKKELGLGSYGKVYLVTHKKTKAVYAMKVIDKLSEDNLEIRDNFNREIEIMYKLNHPNIVKLYGHFEDEKFCYFLMQYIPKNTLYDMVPQISKSQNYKLIASIMKDILKALYYLHSMKPTIIHRDIKSDNILLDDKKNAYLTDFGWSNYVSNFRKRTTACGTPVYLPPEIVNDKGHDQTADIWSLGVLLFKLVTGYYPFYGNTMEELEYRITKLMINWPKNMNPEAKDLISKILKLNPKERPKIEQILNHKFISKYYPNSVKELIKPEHQENKIFVVSKDNPLTWGLHLKKDLNISTNSNTKDLNNSRNSNTKTLNILENSNNYINIKKNYNTINTDNTNNHRNNFFFSINRNNKNNNNNNHIKRNSDINNNYKKTFGYSNYKDNKIINRRKNNYYYEDNNNNKNINESNNDNKIKHNYFKNIIKHININNKIKDNINNNNCRIDRKNINNVNNNNLNDINYKFRNTHKITINRIKNNNTFNNLKYNVKQLHNHNKSDDNNNHHIYSKDKYNLNNVCINKSFNYKNNSNNHKYNNHTYYVSLNK